jgi:transposase-like protein
MWFWAIFLMSSTRCRISAKQLEREIGVSNKTALRMFREIRWLLRDRLDDQLSGDVEVDETYYGGKPRAADIRKHRAAKSPKQAGTRWADEKKTLVFGMVERGGRVRSVVMPKDRTGTFKDTVSEHVLPDSMVFTDEHPAYGTLGKHFAGHRRIRHKANIYVDGDVHTNTIEGFFGLLKNGIRGVYHSVSRKHLQSYLDEYAWRYNHRDDPRPMFWTILDEVRKDRLAAS